MWLNLLTFIYIKDQKYKIFLLINKTGGRKQILVYTSLTLLSTSALGIIQVISTNAQSKTIQMKSYYSGSSLSEISCYEEILLASEQPKRRDGRRKFKGTRHSSSIQRSTKEEQQQQVALRGACSKRQMHEDLAWNISNA